MLCRIDRNLCAGDIPRYGMVPRSDLHRIQWLGSWLSPLPRITDRFPLAMPLRWQRASSASRRSYGVSIFAQAFQYETAHERPDLRKGLSRAQAQSGGRLQAPVQTRRKTSLRGSLFH